MCLTVNLQKTTHLWRFLCTLAGGQARLFPLLGARCRPCHATHFSGHAQRASQQLLSLTVLVGVAPYHSILGLASFLGILKQLYSFTWCNSQPQARKTRPRPPHPSHPTLLPAPRASSATGTFLMALTPAPSTARLTGRWRRTGRTRSSGGSWRSRTCGWVCCAALQRVVLCHAVDILLPEPG